MPYQSYCICGSTARFDTQDEIPDSFNAKKVVQGLHVTLSAVVKPNLIRRGQVSVIDNSLPERSIGVTEEPCDLLLSIPWKIKGNAAREFTMVADWLG